MEKNYFRVHVYYACTDFLDNTTWLNSKQLCSNNGFDISNHMYEKRDTSLLVQIIFHYQYVHGYRNLKLFA